MQANGQITIKSHGTTLCPTNRVRTCTPLATVKQVSCQVPPEGHPYISLSEKQLASIVEGCARVPICQQFKPQFCNSQSRPR